MGGANGTWEGTWVHLTARCLTTKSGAVWRAAVVKYLSRAEKAENNRFACSQEFWAVHFSKQLCEHCIDVWKRQINCETFSTCSIIWSELTAGMGAWCCTKSCTGWLIFTAFILAVQCDACPDFLGSVCVSVSLERLQKNMVLLFPSTENNIFDLGGET